MFRKDDSEDMASSTLLYERTQGKVENKFLANLLLQLEFVPLCPLTCFLNSQDAILSLSTVLKIV